MIIITDKIKCSVDNCKFNSNNLCTADEIEVAKNLMYGGVDMETGVMNNKKDSSSSNETKCVTFIQKDE